MIPKYLIYRNYYNNANFLFIQEHWLAHCQLHVLNTIRSTNASHVSSGFNNDDFISGCPYCRCAILWCADLHANVHFVATNNKRICSM